MLFYVSALSSAYPHHYAALLPLTLLFCLYVVCVCACVRVYMGVSHAHCHTPDLYNAPNALDTRLLGKVARECGAYSI